MKKEEIFNQLITAQNILWRGDDRINQEDLFELQDFMAELVLKVAKDVKREDVLLKEFSWLYKSN